MNKIVQIKLDLKNLLIIFIIDSHIYHSFAEENSQLNQMTNNVIEKLVSDFDGKLPLHESVENVMKSSVFDTIDKSVPEVIKKIHNSQQLSFTADEPTVTESAQQINCYECNSHTSVDCMDLENPDKYIRNCSSNAIGCWKIDQWVDYDGGSDLKAHHRVIRQCAIETLDRSCYYRAGFGGRMTACFCDHNLCNTAYSLRHSLVLIFVFVILCVSIHF